MWTWIKDNSTIVATVFAPLISGIFILLGIRAKRIYQRTDAVATAEASTLTALFDGHRLYAIQLERRITELEKEITQLRIENRTIRDQHNECERRVEGLSRRISSLEPKNL